MGQLTIYIKSILNTLGLAYLSNFQINPKLSIELTPLTLINNPLLIYNPQEQFLSDIRSAAGELITGPHQSLPEMSDGHWGTL